MGKLQINGDLLLAGNLMMSTSNISAYSVISVKPDSSAYGQNLIIGAGGNTVIGGGESASAFFTASGIKDEENLYLTADGSVHVYTNCDSIANRKLVMSMEADGNITTTGTIITPGNDSVVIKPAKNNYDQIGASDCKFWKIHATTFYGNLSGNADTASRLLNKYSISGDSHSLALKAAFDTYKNSTPKDEFLTYYSSAYGNGSMYMGYFIGGYDSTPYGGFYVAHYDTPYYVGIQYGSYNQQTILTSSNYATWCAPASHSHSYLPLSGGTMTGSPVIKFPGSQGSIATSDPMAITYGRISAYGTLCINANTDNSGTEYIILTAGKGLSSSAADGLAIGTSTLTWQGSTVLTTGNFPSSSSLARQTDTWISAASLDVNTYYPVVISLPANGLNRIKLAVQLNSSTRPSWSTHSGGFTSNIDVEIIQAGWGTVNPFRYLLRQDDWTFANVKPAYFAGQLSNASLAVFYVRGGGSYRFICDWQDASISLRTSSTTYNDQTVAPTTSTSMFHSGSKSHLYCNVDYASSAGNADTLDGSHASAFAAASHSHSYLPLSGGTMTGAITLSTGGLITAHEAGFTINTYGNFIHRRTEVNDYWNINNYNSTIQLKYYYESGLLMANRIGSTNYGPSLPSSGATGEIFYKT